MRESRPAKDYELFARTSVIQALRSQAVWSCQVFAQTVSEKVLCAVAQGTIASLGQPNVRPAPGVAAGRSP